MIGWAVAIAQAGTDDCPGGMEGSSQQRNQLKSTENKNDGGQSAKHISALVDCSGDMAGSSVR